VGLYFFVVERFGKDERNNVLTSRLGWPLLGRLGGFFSSRGEYVESRGRPSFFFFRERVSRYGIDPSSMSRAG
jgi:hypothetical protein